MHALSRLAQAGNAVQPDRAGNAFERLLTKKVCLQARPTSGMQRVANDNSAGAGLALHPCGQIDRFADHRQPLGMPGLALGEHDLAKADTDRGLKRAAKLQTERRQHLGLNRQRSTNRAQRIVAVGHGRTENRHHRIADIAFDHAAESMHHSINAPGVAANDGVQVFGVDFGGQAGEVGQVGEQDGDIAALAHRPAR